MPKLQLCRLDSDAIEFSVHVKSTHEITARSDKNSHIPMTMQESSGAATEMRNTLALASTMSQRMEDLAREFDCLGYFGSDDGPKAA